MGKNSKIQKTNIRPVAIKNKAIINNTDKLKSNNIYYLSALLFLLVAVPVFIYLPSLNGKFTNWDDPVYVLVNKNVHNLSWENIKYFFTNSSASNYHPVTMISLSIDYFFSAKKNTPLNVPTPDPALFHFVNLILHLLNILLVFFFIYRLTKKNSTIAFISALLFGIHPMHVESVAWISERKDVLYAFFFLAGLIFYLKFTETKSVKYYLLCLLFYIFSLLSKPAAVVFPLLLFCIDYYLNRRFNFKLIFEKIPVFILALIFGIITLVVQSHDAIASFTLLSIPQRMFCVSFGLLMYVVRLFVPYGLSAFYPFPTLSSSGFLPAVYYISPIIISVLAIIIFYIKKYSKIPAFGFLFFLLSIFLVLQIISVGKALMADRYTYIPYIGLFFIIGYYSDYLLNRQKNNILKYFSAGVILIYISCMIYLSAGRVNIWQNSGTLWTDVIEKYPACDLGYNNRGTYYYKIDSFELARRDYAKAVIYNPTDPMAFRNLGNVSIKLDSTLPAIAYYTRALAVNAYAQAYDSNAYLCYLNRGNLYGETRQFGPALADYNKALELCPDSKMIMLNRAHVFADMNDYQSAIRDYNLLVPAFPLRDDLLLKRGFCYFSLGNFPEALKDFLRCLELNPANGNALYNCSVIYYKNNDFPNALKYALEARRRGNQVNQPYIDMLQKKQGR